MESNNNKYCTNTVAWRKTIETSPPITTDDQQQNKNTPNQGRGETMTPKCSYPLDRKNNNKELSSPPPKRSEGLKRSGCTGAGDWWLSVPCSVPRRQLNNSSILLSRMANWLWIMASNIIIYWVYFILRSTNYSVLRTTTSYSTSKLYGSEPVKF
jgi:hypothetical protein